ncbi:hypothetical protein ISN45_Aa02g004730 [Arabidopsis thaliana x Arabidopsis arenosa]|uniref:Uncharacterized protein n=1 Tax=Arabidopsis thaliana x Arabidopsis arenosa TaxID=1240361 RepID=A0A8T2BN16_9BRAS|nr:hypothetical protein ISN45_Aa02g004730 [Arabidopsis thaliana x Arabidopsis arenosa]
MFLLPKSQKKNKKKKLLFISVDGSAGVIVVLRQLFQCYSSSSPNGMSLQTPAIRFLIGHEATIGEKNLKFGIQGKISFKLSYVGDQMARVICCHFSLENRYLGGEKQIQRSSMESGMVILGEWDFIVALLGFRI